MAVKSALFIPYELIGYVHLMGVEKINLGCNFVKASLIDGRKEKNSRNS